MKNTPIELLSPAKDLEVGLAAINHGADAVYIGGPAFGAREKASNTIEDIEKLCRHAALFDAKVYVTLNTLLRDDELEQARALAYDCWNAGVDALIIQDMQLLQLDLPPIALHASTQCDNLTVEKVQQLEQAGFSQVVLGRELTIDQIREIRQQTTVPLEFFVHGALCVSHSGQCYLSEYIGNRSANRGACAQPCRLPWDLLDEQGNVLIKNRHLLSLKDLNNSAHLEELMDAGISSFKIEGRMKEADYVKNITAYYRQKIDAILERRPEYVQASKGHCSYSFEVNPEKSFNRGFTDFFFHGRQPGIDSPFTPKSMGEYIGEVKWCNSVQMEILTEKVLHNGDGLCFLNDEHELVGLRADVVNGHKVSCNRPHNAFRGAKIYRNYDIEWQRQVEASTGNRKIDIDLVLSETDTGFSLTCQIGNLSPFTFHLSPPKIPANNPEKALENIRRKLAQWGDTIYNPVSITVNLSQPYLIPASVLGEMKRGLLDHLASVPHHLSPVSPSYARDALSPVSPGYARDARSPVSPGYARDARSPGVIKSAPLRGAAIRDNSHLSPFTFHLSPPLMTCHHCIRYANGLCPKITGKPVGQLFIRNGSNTFRLDFDCSLCQMYIYPI